MNIWAWVRELRRDLEKSGQSDLSRKIGQMSTLSVRGEADRVEAIFPEVLAAATALEMPWLEVFARHWSLQSRVIPAGQGLPCLTDAVDAFERANRDATRDCPQSICATQDLALCFGNVDDVGFAPDILQATEENLARIDPTWSCFVCLTSIQTGALIDLDRGEEAVETYLTARRSQAELGIRAGDSFRIREASILASVGRYAEALEVLDGPGLVASNDLATPTGRSRRSNRPSVLAHLGRHREARESLLPFAEVRERIHLHVRWALTIEILVGAGEWPNDAELGEQLQTLVAANVAVGRSRPSARLALLAGRLAVQRGALSSAGHALSTAVEQAEGLRSRAQLAPKIDALAAEVAALRRRSSCLPQSS